MEKRRPTSPQTATTGPTPPTANVTVDPYADILRLARSTTSRARYFSEVMRCLVRAFTSPYGAVHVRSGAEVIQDDAHFGPTDPRFWKDGLQQFLTESLTEARSRAKLLQAKGGNAKVAFLSAPLFDPSGPSIGAVALVVPCDKNIDWTTRLAALEGLCRLASVCTEFLGGGVRETSSRGIPDRGLSRAAAYESPEQFAFAITNELRNKLGYEQVALGWIHRRRIRILSISGLDQVSGRSPGVACLRAAMEECYDAGAVLIHPRLGDWADEKTCAEYPLHKQWCLATKGDCVASITLRSGGAVLAVLSLRTRSDRPFTPEQLEDVRAKVEPLVPGFDLVRRASRGWGRHLRESGRESLDALLAPKRWGRKVAAVLGIMLATGFFFGSVTYHLTVPCVVTPSQVRHVHASSAGVLRAIHALQGNRIRAGDVLCEFDHRDLDQQRRELVAQFEVLERERDRALSVNAPAEAQLALANQELIRAKLDILDTHIERAVVRSPIDGMVVWGDLRQAVGAVLPLGEPLFQIAPTDRWTVELEVPEAAAANLNLGLQGVFATTAEPGEPTSFSIDRLRPTAQLRKNQNVYVAEADVTESRGSLKPGMEGVAKIRVGSRRVCWIVMHRLLEYLQLHLWL